MKILLRDDDIDPADFCFVNENDAFHDSIIYLPDTSNYGHGPQF